MQEIVSSLKGDANVLYFIHEKNKETIYNPTKQIIGRVNAVGLYYLTVAMLCCIYL